MADLGRWLTGSYRIAGTPAEPVTAQTRDSDDEDEPDHTDR
jgi:endogenous inhibitor of DNA gyrase (YacG/DUF329 family)